MLMLCNTCWISLHIYNTHTHTFNIMSDKPSNVPHTWPHAYYGIKPTTTKKQMFYNGNYDDIQMKNEPKYETSLKVN